MVLPLEGHPHQAVRRGGQQQRTERAVDRAVGDVEQAVGARRAAGEPGVQPVDGCRRRRRRRRAARRSTTGGRRGWSVGGHHAGVLSGRCGGGWRCRRRRCAGRRPRCCSSRAPISAYGQVGEVVVDDGRPLLGGQGVERGPQVVVGRGRRRSPSAAGCSGTVADGSRRRRRPGGSGRSPCGGRSSPASRARCCPAAGRGRPAARTRNVSDQASSASAGPSRARHTRSTTGAVLGHDLLERACAPAHPGRPVSRTVMLRRPGGRPRPSGAVSGKTLGTPW